MNPVGQPLKQQALSKGLIAAGIIGLILFIMFQVLPSAQGGSPELGTSPVSRSEAREKAADFAAQKLGYNLSDGTWNITYQSDSSFFGYMSREKLLDDYTKKKLDHRYPYDIYYAAFTPAGQSGALLTVNLNMYTGEVTGFARGNAVPGAASRKGGQSIAASKEEPALSLAQKEQLARPWLQAWGVNPAKLQMEAGNGSEAGLIYSDSSVAVGESRLQYRFTFDGGDVSSFKPGFTAPSWHTSYVADQKSLATRLTLFGYGIPTLALGILALVYSVLKRSHTSFKRGLFLSAAHFLIMLATTYNVLPESTNDSIEGKATSIIMFVIYVLYSLLMSSLLYFSLVGGNGLWRNEEGLNPWPQAKEPGYGQYVLDSVKAGYIWAFVLLGVQTVMFIILSLTLHNWSTTDASQSPFNMKYAWLLPVIAWLAGMSEEAIYRLFGIRMLKKIVRSTWIASLITTLVWAFGHTLYPIYPISSRPIELTVVGLLFSYIFLRHGFIAVMFAHVVFDSILMGATLIFMKDSVNVGAGLFAIVMPFLVGYIVYLFNRTKRTADSGASGSLS